MDLFVNDVIEHKVVVGQRELKKCGVQNFKFFLYVLTRFIYTDCGDTTSKETKTSLSSILISDNSLENCKELATE